ncbi:MAG: L-type lectin-domain containing protein, partial [bacterium]|nr:L-type lectin-domain containing protein [bacterium]
MACFNKTIYLTILSLFLFGTVLAQETCDNSVDDDGDGLVDCYDPDCANSNDCSEFYFGNSIICEEEATANPEFDITLKWASPNESAHNKASVSIGDLDNDGIPEVVTTNHLAQTLNVINGATGEWLYTRNVGYNIGCDATIGNIENDDCAEIFIRRQKSNVIEAYNCDLTTRLWSINSSISSRAQHLSLADFNQDGTPELYHANEILDPMTGAKIIAGSGSWNSNDISGGSVAVDIFPDSYCSDCSGLELVDGRYVYSINISTGTRTVLKDMNDYVSGGDWYPKLQFNRNFTLGSVADFNEDGNMDLLIPGALGSSTSGTSTIFFWDIVNDQVLTYQDPTNNFTRGSGRINIADMDDDGVPDASFVSNQYLYCLNNDMTLKWRKSIKEGSSGFTGCSVFDFNGDGTAEVVYRSESTLHIIDGTDGSSRKTIYCQSRTWYEYPQVADVDGDGASELIVTCSTDDSLPFDPYSGSINSQVRVYAAADGEVWQPARSVWNQHAYFNVNVDDDLTIPQEQQDHTVVFGNVDCQDGSTSDVRSLNSFLNQAPFLNETGCPEYSSPDLELAGPISATPSLCPETTFDVTFTVNNVGDMDLSGALPVTFYSGDPESTDLPYAEKLNTEFEILSDFNPGESIEVTMQVVGSGGEFDLYIVLNDAGGQDPPFTINTSSIQECDVGNNKLSTDVFYTPFTLQADFLKDNEKCDPLLPDNGQAQAYYSGTIPGITEVVWLEDFEDLSDGTNNDTGETAWSISYSGNSNRAEVDNNFGGQAFECNNTDAVVTWTSESIDISAYETVDVSVDMFSSGDLETSADYIEFYYSLDGGSYTLLTNGRQLGNFGYFQALGEDFSGSTIQFQARVYNTAGDEVYYFDNVRVEGTTAPETGDFTDGFTFNWYNLNDFSSILYTGDTWASMPEGSYSVIGLYDASNCFSDTAQIDIALTSNVIDLVLYETNPVTDCATPNGQLTAGVRVDSDTITAGYTFEWYIGATQTPDDLIGTGSVASNLSATEYLVVVTDNTTGCDESTTLTVSTDQVQPDISLDATTDITDCAALDGGSATVSSTDDVTFLWYDGSSVKAVADFTGATYSGLTSGEYTVVAQDNGSSCTSEPLAVTINNLTGAPNITTTMDVENTSCGDGNGQVSASATASGSPTFTYEWFTGNSTSASQSLPGSSTSSAFLVDANTLGGLPAGDYTVRVTNDDNNCSDTQLVTVTETLIDPVIDGAFIVITARTACSGGAADPNNGAIDATHASAVTGGSGNYQFDLYNGNSASGTVLASNTTGDFPGLNSGNYTIEVIDLDTDCVSEEFNAQVPLERDEPILAEGTVTANTYCTGGNGSVVITSSSTNEPADGYEFSIFEGNNTNESNLVERDTITNGAIGKTFENLNSGSHRVEVINLSNNCSEIISVTIPDSPETFTISSSFGTDNTSCVAANANGFASVNMNDGNSNYTFKWYNGDLVDEGNRRAEDGNSISDLEAGNYTVVAVSNESGCESDPVTIPIGEDPFVPDLTIVEEAPSTSCVTDNAELRAYAEESDNPGVELNEDGGYTFQWYLGSDTSTPIAGQDSSYAEGLAAFQEYTVEVTHTETGCTQTASFTVTQDINRPTISLDNMVQNTVCSDASTDYDGSLTAAVTYEGSGVTLPSTDYEFTWYNGSTTSDPVISGETSHILSNQPAGFYTVTVRNNADGSCDSDPITFEITDNLDNPDSDLDATRTNNNTVCDITTNASGTYDGQISVTPTTGDVSDYTWTWFVGVSTDASDEVTANITDALVTVTSTNSELSQIPGGTYTVLIENNTNGCTFSEQFSITDETAIPEIDFANSEVNDNTYCSSPGNGSIVAALDLSGTTINGVENTEIWQAISSCNSVILDDATAVGDNGFQLTTATNNQFGRVWLGDTLDLSQPLRFDFELYLGDKDNSGADGIAFTMHRDSRGYDARGRVGGNLGVGDAATSSGSETKIEPAITIEFDTWQNGDVSDPSYDHMNLFLNGNVDVQTTAPVQIRDGEDNVENGDTLQVTIVVTQVGADQNLQVWVDGSMRIDYTDDIVTNIFSGNSDVIAGFTSSTGGSNNDQAIFLTPYFDNFSFEWWNGNTVDAANLRSETDPFLCDLSAGQYTLRVTDNTTGCVSNIQVFDIIDDAANPDLTATEVSAATICAGGTDPDGSATVTINNANGSTDYTYAWYAGTSASGTVLGTAATLEDREAGQYTVLVTDTDGDGLGCTSTATVEITEDFPTITIDASTTVGASDCNTGLDNGSFTIDNVAEDGVVVGVVGDYNYEYFDNTAASIQGPSAVNSITDLAPGNYSVVITNNTSQCGSASIPFTIADESVTPIPSLATVDNSDCSGTSGNGSITATVTNTDAANSYTFEWYYGASADVGDTGASTLINDGDTYNGATVNITDGAYTGNVLENLPANATGEVYWVRVTDDTDPSSSCYTDIDATIIDDAEDMTVTAATPTASDQCTPANGSIELTGLDIDGTVTNTAAGFETLETNGYVFDVLQSDASTLEKTFNISADGGSGTFPGADALNPGTYYIRVTNSLSCVGALYQFEIDDNSVVPTLTASEDAASTICAGGDNPDGQASVTITNDDLGTYTYQWYRGNSATGGNEVVNDDISAGFPSGATSATLSGIYAGFYTVEVTDTDGTGTGCTNTVTIEITDNPATITIDASTNVGASDCNTGLDNGSFTITAVAENGTVVGAVGDYNYEFYDNTAASIQGPSTTNSITGLAPGNYSVVITNNTSQCASASLPFTIADESVTPIPSLAVVDNSDCSGTAANGSITATVTNPDAADSYTFTWYVSASADFGDPGSSTAITSGVTAYNGTTLTISDGAYTGNILNNVTENTAGDVFWVRVTDDTDPSSSCYADINATVINDPDDITVTAATPTGSDQCTPSNGSIELTSLDIDGAVTNTAAGFETLETNGYVFDVLQSDGSTLEKTFNISADGGTNTFPGADALDPGTYFIRVTNDLSCVGALYQFEIDDNSVVPTLTAAEDSPSTICDGGDSPNGQATVTITNDDTGTYTYQWYRGNSATGGNEVANDDISAGFPSGATTATLSGVYAGFYTVEVTDTDGTGTGCTNTVTVEVTDDPATITIDASTTVGASDCNTGLDNGSFTINDVAENGTVVGVVGDYNYEFFDNTATSIQGPNTTNSISGLSPGNYTVIITNNSSQCTSASLPFTIDDESVIPILSLTVVDNSSCVTTGANGSITVDITNPDAADDYSFTWYIGDDASEFGDTGASTMITGGATSYNSNTLTIGDDGSYTGNVLGSLPAMADGDDIFWVRVQDGTDPSSSCYTDISATIIDDPADITVTGATPTASDQCTPSNGSIELTALEIDGATTNTAAGFETLETAGYVFDVLQSDASTLEKTFNIAADGGTNTFPGADALAPGTYFIRVTNDLSCVGALYQFEIDDNSVVPTLTAAEDNASSVCAGGSSPDGQASVTITNDDLGTYTYQWYRGSSATTGNEVTNDDISAGFPSGATTATLSGVFAGFFTVEVTDTDGTGAGCVNTVTVQVTENEPVIALGAVTNVGASDCNTGLDNGSFTITSVTEDASVVAAVGDYTYEFFDNTATSIQGPNSTNSITGLSPGNYSVIITRTSSQCVSGSIDFTIADDSYLPIPALAVSDNTDCSGAAPNGSITATVSNADAADDYSFVWYIGDDATEFGDITNSTEITSGVTNYNGATLTISNGAYTGNILEDLPSMVDGDDIFWVRVTDGTDPSSSCYADISATIADDPADITITAATATGADQCAPTNGSIELTAIDVDGAVTNTAAGFETLETAGYVFDVLQSDASTLEKTFNIAADGGTNTFPSADGLDPGTYYIRATNDLSCVGALYQFEIDDNSVVPTLTAAEDAPSTICAGGTSPDGQATVTITNDDLGTYTYQWYRGTSATAGNEVANDDISAGFPSGATTATLSGVYAGFFTVEVSDADGTGNGCSNTVTVEITEDAPVITLGAVTNVGASDCNTGLDNGSFTITSVTEDASVVAAVGDYTYEFFDNTATSIQGPSTTNSITGLTPGNYSVIITRTSSQCVSGSVDFTIADDSYTPIPDLTVVDNSDCSGAAPNGSITATVTNADAADDYSFEWYIGDDASEFGDITNSTLIVTGVTNYNGATLAISDGAYTGNILEDLPSMVDADDIFWVRVTDGTDPSSSCYADISATIADDPADISVTVTGANITDATDCTPDDGEVELVEISIDGALTNTAAAFEALETAGYVFDVLQSDGTTVEKTFDVAADGGTNTFPAATQLAPGIYFIRITNDLSCESALYQFEIDDNIPVPVIAATTNDNTNCTGTANGSASITLDGITTGHTYQWYFGTIAGGGTAISNGDDLGNNSDALGATGASLTQVGAGTYYVEASDNDASNGGTGCVIQQEFTINDDLAVIAISASGVNQDNTICDPTGLSDSYDGEYEVTGVTSDGGADAIANYDFEWYTSGGSLIITTDGSADAGVNNDLDAGDYQVIAVNKSTGCESAPVAFTIGDNTTDPDLSGANSTVTDSESCDNTNFANGNIDVDPDGNTGNNPAGYTFEWYTGGTATIGTGTLIASETGDDLDNIAPGTYSVRVIIDATNCFTDLEFVVGSVVAGNPTLTLSEDVQVTDCNNPDGQISGTPGTGAATDYNWFWFGEDKTTAIDDATIGGTVSADGDVVTTLPEGTYYAVIQNQETGCVSDTMSIDLGRAPAATMTISETVTSAPGDCSADEGEFTLDITGASGATVNVTIEDESNNTLFTDATATPGVSAVVVNGTNNTGFINGTYLVTVIDDGAGGTGCTETYEFFLPYQEAPRLDLAVPTVITHSNNCQPYEGTAIVSGDNTNGVTGGQGGATGVVDITLTLIDAESTGDSHANYQVFLYQGEDPLPSPDMDLEFTVADATGLTVGMSITVSGSTADITSISGTDIVADFTGGDVDDFATGNTVVENGQLITAVINDGYWPTPTRDADIQVIEGTITGQNQADLGFGTTGIGFDDVENTYTFSGLTAGNYTVMAAQEGIAFCLSPSVTFEIEDRFFELDIDATDVNYVEVTGDTNCDGVAANSDGIIEIKQIDRVLDDGAGGLTVDGTDDATVSTDYTYEWFAGDDVTDPDLATTYPSATISAIGNSVSDIPAGTYTVRITNGTVSVGSGDACTATYTYEVPENPDDMVVAVTPTANTNCVATYNGEIQINTVNVNSTGATAWNSLTNYTAELYEVGNATAIQGPISSGIADVFSNLQDGDYSVVVTNPNSCESTATLVTVADGSSDPTLTETSSTNNTSCTAANGEITIDLGSAVGDYNYQWYVGDISSTTTFTGTEGNPSGTETQISGISEGTYTLQVTDNADPDEGCFSFITVSIQDNVYDVTTFTFNTSDVTDCTPDNGQIELTGVDAYNTFSDDANTYPADGALNTTFDITVYQTDGTSVVDTDADNDNIIDGLSPGDYLIEINFATSGCTSAQRAFTISDDADNPTVAIVQDAANTICDPSFGALEADGQLTATVTGDADDNYDFQWYLGATGDVSTPINDTDVLNNSTVSIDESGTRTSVISNLSEGTYWVEVTDNTTANLACTVSGEITLTSNFTDVTLDVANVTANPATDCTSPANGSISIDLADISGSGTLVTDFTISIDGVNTNTGDNAALAMSSDPELISGLEPDTYNIIITDETTGCLSDTYQVVVGQDGTEPTLNAIVINDDNFCTGGNGAIRIEVTAPDTDEANYTFNWFQGTDTSDPWTAAEGSPGNGATAGIDGAGGGGDEASNVEAGFYTIVVTALGTAADGVGCVDQIVVEVEDDPYTLAITNSTSN